MAEWEEIGNGESVKFDPETMIYVASIPYCRRTAIVACDGKCHLNPKADQTYPKPCEDPKYFPTRFCARDCPRSFLSQPSEDLSKYEPYLSVIPVENAHNQEDETHLKTVIKPLLEKQLGTIDKGAVFSGFGKKLVDRLSEMITDEVLKEEDKDDE